MLIYERRLGSLRALMIEAKNMDADAGLRVLGRYDARNCYVFVTRFGNRYTAMVYERLPGRKKTLGRRLAVMDYELTELRSFLGKLTSGRFTAFSY